MLFFIISLNADWKKFFFWKYRKEIAYQLGFSISLGCCELRRRKGGDKGKAGSGFRGKSKGEEGVKRGLLRVTEVEAWRRPTH